MKWYCSECGAKLPNKNVALCERCGQLTTAVAQRKPKEQEENAHEQENFLTDGDKKLLRFIGVLSIVSSSVIILIVTIMLIVVVWLLNGSIAEQDVANNIVLTVMVVIIDSIAVAEQIAIIIFSIMVCRAKQWAVIILRIMYTINAITSFIMFNIIGGVLCLVILSKIKTIMTRMKGGSEYNYKMKLRRDDERRLQEDPTRWRCKFCGYINDISSSECKSCGR